MRFIILLILAITTAAAPQSESSRLGGLGYPEFVKVAGGTIAMGDEWMIGYADEQPVHEVTLKDFSISKTEVTVGQYRAFCRAVGKSMPSDAPNWGWHDNNPMVYVTWYDAVAYCDWLSEKTGNLCRLPTEAEWEYAARGGAQSKGYKYSGSQSPYSVAWFSDNSNKRTQAVATKSPNELGLYDMSGNVYEWCIDWYANDYYSNSPSSNPRGPATGTNRVLRGGSWLYSATDCRVAWRNRYSPGTSLSSGFRVVFSN